MDKNKVPHITIGPDAQWLNIVEYNEKDERNEVFQSVVGLMLNKSRVGTILGILSILPVIGSIIFFYTKRGPIADIYLFITIFSVFFIIGIILAGISSRMSIGRISKLLIGLVGIITSLAVIVVAFLLLLAMGSILAE